MNMGLGFSEILFVLVLVLIFFGSKELPRFIREGARLAGKLRGYADKVKRELNDVTSTVTGPAQFPVDNAVDEKKKELRSRFLAARKSLTPPERAQKAKTIHDFLKQTVAFKKAGAVLIYVDMGSEVETRSLIGDLLALGKKVVVPYLKPDLRTLGIAAITDCEKDIVTGEQKTPEPRVEIRDNFFRTDLGLILCPGVAFDHLGGRLGRGKAYYDNFLRELRGKVPIYGLAFECQFMAHEQLPFSYSDVSMNQIITEQGFKLNFEGDQGENPVSTERSL